MDQHLQTTANEFYNLVRKRTLKMDYRIYFPKHRDNSAAPTNSISQTIGACISPCLSIMANTWDKSLIAQAAQALLDYTHKKESGRNILVEDDPRYIMTQIQLIKPVGKSILKPVRVSIPYSLFSKEHDNSACLFVRSVDIKVMEEYFVLHPSSIITKIISLDQVVKVYATFQSKKELLSKHSHFLCDERIVSHLYNSLGKVFSSRHKYPIPIDLENQNKIEANIEKVVSSTYMHVTGSNISIRLGHTSMSCNDIVENIIQGLDCAVTKFGHGNKQSGLANVHSIHIKTNTSASLPIYTKVSNEIMKYVKTLSNGDVTFIEEKKKTKKVKEVLEEEEVEVAPKVTKKKRGVEEVPQEKAVKVKKAKTVEVPAVVITKEPTKKKESTIKTKATKAKK
jgi:ribosome biogenesis protein UTP30